jgi:hypothetical protein
MYFKYFFFKDRKRSDFNDEDSTSIDVSDSIGAEEERFSEDINKLIESLGSPEDIEKFKKVG